MESNNFGFDIEGILPLGPGDKNAFHFDSFSLCFHPGGAGSLRFGDGGGSIESTGQWQISISDISVEGTSTNIKGYAIPDSGTTLLISPSTSDLSALFLNICSVWAGCKKSNGKKGDNVDDFIKSVGHDCGRTTPPLSFNFGDATAVVQGSSYVVSSSGKCKPAFDVDSSFGVWILGLPVFRSNQVHFDHTGKVGFTPGCGECGGNLNQQSSEVIWTLDGPPRWPTTSRHNGASASAFAPQLVPLLTDLSEEMVVDHNVVALTKYLHERVW